LIELKLLVPLAVPLSSMMATIEFNSAQLCGGSENSSLNAMVDIRTCDINAEHSFCRVRVICLK
jgi:hypothetical protein